jgi:hypothetical protein
MNFRKLNTATILATVILCLFGLPNVAISETSPIQQMSIITAHINHFPTDSDKETLKMIGSNMTGEAENKALAKALINMKHSITATDKTALKMLLTDDSVSAAAKSLANILLGINHKPSAEDLEILRKLM